MKIYKIPPKPKRTVALWWFCRIGLLIWGVVMLCLGHPVQFLQAIFGTIFMGLWDYFQLLGRRTFIAQINYKLQSSLNIFIFLGCVVGTSINVFTSFEHIDIPSHFFAGYISVFFGYDLGVLLQSKYGKLSPALASMFGLAVACTMLVGWEIYEFSMDRLYGLHLQMSWPNTDAGLLDTMWDFIIGVSGAVAGMFYVAFERSGYIGTNKKTKEERALEKAKHPRIYTDIPEEEV